MLTIVPYGIKMSYYTFMSILLPIYGTHYPLTNFFNLCDLSLVMVLVSFLTDTHLFISMSALAISIIQLFWCIDFIIETLGMNFLGSSAYMYKTSLPWYLRSLSLFHAWFPFFLLYLINQVGYDPRALYYQLVLSNSICLLSYYHSDLYNDNVNVMQDFHILKHLIAHPVMIISTHYFLIWWTEPNLKVQ